MKNDYLNWILIWINAIIDSYLWADSCNNFLYNVDYIHSNHDINSNLRKYHGDNKFYLTNKFPINTEKNLYDNLISWLFNLTEWNSVKIVCKT